MVSVIIPTFNEEENIRELIAYLNSCQRRSDFEVIICDAPTSTDNVSTIATNLGVKVVKSQYACRSHQMNFGAQYAKFNILYFLHADARPPLNFVDLIVTGIHKKDFGIFSYAFDRKGILLKINAFFTKFDGLFAGGGDQSLFIKRTDFETLGGYSEELKIMEDFDLYRRAKREGFKPTIVQTPLLISARKYEQNSWLKVNLINLSIFFLYWFKGSQRKMISLNSLLT